MKQRPFIKAKMTNLRESQEVGLMQAGDHVLSFTLCLSLVQAQHAVGQSMQMTVRKCRAQKQWVEDVIQLRMTQLCPTLGLLLHLSTATQRAPLESTPPLLPLNIELHILMLSRAGGEDYSSQK